MARTKPEEIRKGALKVSIPTALTSFVGRSHELTDIGQLLGSARLLTLTGAAGCGKTRLALRVASGFSGQYKDGVHWVELAPLNNDQLVPNAVARVLNVTEKPGRLLTDELVGVLQSKQLLLVLDNCEHLLRACARLIESLMQVSGVSVLVTSREPLRVAGEMLYPVAPMALPPAGLSLEDAYQFDSMQLFVERARAILPHFELTSDNASIVAKICRHLDGIPLAIELASARVNMLSLEQIAVRLDDRFELLTQATHITHSHHRTLRTAIDWSYALLTTPEQMLLRRISVFAGGCSLATVEEVCMGKGMEREQILELLSSLVNKSLVVAQTLQLGEARYSLLETIRDYAQEKLLVSDDWSATQDRHLQCFLKLAEETAPKLIERYQQIWLDWLEVEHANFQVALAWALERGHIEAGLRIAIALYEFWQKRGYIKEALDWLERFLMKADEKVSLVVHANAFASAAHMAMLLGNTSATIEYGQKAGALGQATGKEEQSNIAVVLVGLASSMRAAGDYPTAFTIGERAIQLLRASGDLYRLGRILIMQAGTAMPLGRYDTVHTLLDEGLNLAREAGDSYRIALILNFLGDLARCEQDFAGAKPNYENSILLFRDLEAKRDVASVLQNLGHACLHLDEVERARILFQESLALQQEQENTPGIAECLIGFAAMAISHDLPAAGIRLLSAAIALGGERPANVWTATRMEYERYLELARANLTDAKFQAEQAAGSALSLEQAIDYAQHLPLQPARESGKTPDDLTAREREIAIWIAQGKSNAEIAQELVLSKRTVEKHIANILSKLGATNRAQIVGWVIQSGLLKFTE
jgi:predicted ATPase/DNA-binding CsgD family transcriptional regulator